MRVFHRSKVWNSIPAYEWHSTFNVVPYSCAGHLVQHITAMKDPHPITCFYSSISENCYLHRQLKWHKAKMYNLNYIQSTYQKQEAGRPMGSHKNYILWGYCVCVAHVQCARGAQTEAPKGLRMGLFSGASPGNFKQFWQDDFNNFGKKNAIQTFMRPSKLSDIQGIGTGVWLISAFKQRSISRPAKTHSSTTI